MVRYARFRSAPAEAHSSGFKNPAAVLTCSLVPHGIWQQVPAALKREARPWRHSLRIGKQCEERGNYHGGLTQDPLVPLAKTSRYQSGPFRKIAT